MSSTKYGNEVGLVGLDSAFCRVSAVVVWAYQLVVQICRLFNIFDKCLGHFIIEA